MSHDYVSLGCLCFMSSSRLLKICGVSSYIRRLRELRCSHYLQSLRETIHFIVVDDTGKVHIRLHSSQIWRLFTTQEYNWKLQKQKKKIIIIIIMLLIILTSHNYWWCIEPKLMRHYLDSRFTQCWRSIYAFRPHDYIFMNSFDSLFFDDLYAIVPYLCHVNNNYSPVSHF